MAIDPWTPGLGRHHGGRPGASQAHGTGHDGAELPHHRVPGDQAKFS